MTDPVRKASSPIIDLQPGAPVAAPAGAPAAKPAAKPAQAPAAGGPAVPGLGNFIAPTPAGVASARVIAGALQADAAVKLSPLVPAAVQRRTLEKMEKAVDAILATGQNAVGQYDFDLTTLLPYARTHAALAKLAQQYPELAAIAPEKREVIPGYTAEAYRAFIDENGFKPAMWAPRLQEYWTAAPLESDTVNPGFVEHLEKLLAKRGKDGARFIPVFNSGRWNGTPDQSMQPLRDAGIAIDVVGEAKPELGEAVLFIGNDGGDGATKKARQEEIAKLGRTAFIVDDRKSNRDAVLEGLALAGIPTKDVVSVAIAAPRFSVDPVTRKIEDRISTFQDV